MAQRSHVPKFGDWETEDDVPYSMVFENARKDKKGGKPNSSDLRDVSKSETPGKIGLYDFETGPDESESKMSVDSPLHSNAMRRNAVDSVSYPGRHDGTLTGGSKSESEAPKGSVIPRHEHQLSQEEGDVRKPTDSPLHHDIAVRKSNHGSPLNSAFNAGDTTKRATRKSAGSDRSIDHSPLHPQSQARIGRKVTGVSSPSWDRKGSSGGTHGQTHSTPERSRLRSVTRGDETADHGPIIPRFGDWDEDDPASAEQYSQVFGKVRDEKQFGEGKANIKPTTETSFTSVQKRKKIGNSKSCGCIPWGRS